MNIIRHLSKTVSPQILGNTPKASEKALLKDFYAIFLAQLSEQSTYDTLTNYHKLPAKKISWYKFVHNIDWQENSADKLLRRFAKAHNLDETDVYDLLKAVTPLPFFEVQAQPDHSSIPVYLQSLLHSDDKHSFANNIPTWAMNLLPDTLNDSICTVQEKLKHSNDVQDSDQPIVNKAIVSNEPPLDKATTTISPQPSAVIATTTSTDKTLLNNHPHQDKELPTAVHAKISPQTYTTPTTDDMSMDAVTEHSGSIGFMKNILPVIGLLIFAGLIWSMLRGCSSDLASQPKVEETEQLTTTQPGSQDKDIAIVKTEDGQKIKHTIESNNNSTGNEDTASNTYNKTQDDEANSNEQTVKETKANIDETSNKTNNNSQSSTDGTHTRLSIEVDNEGNLLKADIQAGSNALGFKLNKAISNIYSEVALRNSKMTINESLKTDMLTMDKVNDLLTLVKETPQGSMVIDGKNVSMNALRNDDRLNLIHQAQTILPSIKVIDGKTGKPATIEESSTQKKSENTATTLTDKDKANSNKTDKANDDTNTTINAPTTDDSSVTEEKAIETTDNSLSGVTQPLSKPLKLTKPEAVFTDGALDIQETVRNSNNASKQAIDTLSTETDLQTVIDALNMQIINFEVNANGIPNENKAILNKAARILKDRDIRIKVMGHTDSDGNPDHNERLSQDRSYAVKKYLMSKGVPSLKIKADGAGEKKPVASNSNPEGKFRNRRIEFSVISSD